MTEKQLYNRVRIITATAVVLLFALVAVIIVQSIMRGNIAKSNQRLSQNLQTLKQTEESLDAEIERRNSSSAVQAYAREKLGYTFNGEKRYKVTDE